MYGNAVQSIGPKSGAADFSNREFENAIDFFVSSSHLVLCWLTPNAGGPDARAVFNLLEELVHPLPASRNRRHDCDTKLTRENGEIKLDPAILGEIHHVEC